MSKVCANVLPSMPSSDVLSSPLGFAVVCFISGLGAASVLGALMPSAAEDDDVRSFVSFGVGAFICCFLQNKVLATGPQKPSKCTKPSLHREAPPKACNKLSKTDMPLECAPPPGLEQSRAPGLQHRAAPPMSPPGLAQTSVRTATIDEVIPYDPKSFRQDIMVIMRDLSMHRNVGRAVQAVRLRCVPSDRQAVELADIITFSLEETRGAVRRSYIAFIAGISGVFEKVAFVDGVRSFFDDVYPHLCDEVPKLSKVVAIELLPTLRSVLSNEEVVACMPPDDIVEYA